MKGAPATFYEFYKNYYTPADTLYRKKADFGYRNEIDCLLKFAMIDMGLEFRAKYFMNFSLKERKPPRFC